MRRVGVALLAKLVAPPPLMTALYPGRNVRRVCGGTHFPEVMIKPTQVGVFLIAAILSGGLLWGALDSAAAGDVGADAPKKPRASVYALGVVLLVQNRATA